MKTTTSILLFLTLTLSSQATSKLLDIKTEKSVERFSKKIGEGETFSIRSLLTYPIVRSKDKKLAKNINNAISPLIVHLDLKKALYDDLERTNGEYGGGDWENSKLSVFTLMPTMFVLKFERILEMSGGPSDSSYFFHIYDRKSGKKVNFDSLFIKNYKKRLRIIAKKIYTAKEPQPFDAPVDSKKDKFILPKAMGINNKGLLLQYGYNEVDYLFMDAEHTIFIKYDLIKDLINPKGKLAYKL